jgi:hypothetical protein
MSPNQQDDPTGASDAGRLERLARHVALQGEAEATRLRAIAERAQEMLADPRFAAIAAAEVAHLPPPFAWERDEEFPAGAPIAVYLASADDFATGEGLTIYFAAGFGRSEDEFRRKLSNEWGAPLADRARIGCGVDAAVPFAPLFVTPALQSSVEAFEKGRGPAAFSFFARHHANYS